MNRRRLLGAAGLGIASLSGCIASGFTKADKPFRTISVDFVDDVPNQFPLSITVETVEESITASHTATIQISITNTGDEIIYVGDGGRRVFSQAASDEDPGLLLLSSSEKVHKIPGCWRPIMGPGRSMDLWTPLVKAEETISEPFDVWGRATNGAKCIPTGTFTFSTKYHVNSVGEFGWRFDLRVR